MGSSKKHKDKDREKGRESRKKRRKSSRSRSRSRSRGRDSSSKREKHTLSKIHREKDSKKRRDSSPSELSHEKVRVKGELTPEHHSTGCDVRVKEETRSSSSLEHSDAEAGEDGDIDFSANTGKDSSLSIANTNKLRAQLGLKPLEVNTIPGLESGEGASTSGNAALSGEGDKEVFVKTENITEKKEAEKLRDRIATQKEKRKIVEKLCKVHRLADDDSDDDAAKWVEKSRKLQQEKDMAERRAKLLEEMDKEFGVGALVEEEFKSQTQKAYTSRDLRGLTVGHEHTVFQEGRSVILTLKDRGVLEEGEDVLENVNILDDERAAKNVENRLRKPEYRPWEEPEVDELGIVKKRNVLSKYDEEIEGKKTSTFKLGTNIQVDREKELELIKLKLKQQGVVSLEMPAPKIANEYYTEGEMVSFKKRKKVKKRVRKRESLRADDLELLPINIEEKVDHGSRFHRKAKPRAPVKAEFSTQDASDENSQVVDMEIDPPSDEDQDLIGPDEDLTGVAVDDEAETELQAVLNKTRKLKQSETRSVDKIIENIKKTSEIKPDPDAENKNSNSIVLNSTAEFCRTLGDIPTYGMSGNRDEEADELMEFERELMEERRRQEEEEVQNRGAWNEVDIDEKPVEIKDRESKPILEEEPDASVGLAGALQLAMKKGYLEKEMKKNLGASRTSQLQAQTYTIEEKFYEDDKFGRRERYAGPLTDFREKDSYKPDIKLEYIDDSGRLLNPKEAFRYLSHKFHGKGPGKNKIDKRMKKLDQEGKLKQMSSTDTPLGTLRLLQEKQKELQSPYILLSGGQKALAQTSIVKTK